MGTGPDSRLARAGRFSEGRYYLKNFIDSG